MNLCTFGSREQFADLAHNVRLRRWYVEPVRVGVALVQTGPQGGYLDFEFVPVPAADQNPYSGVLAEIAHHRSGNAVYELDYSGIRDLEHFFSVYREDVGEYPFVSKVCDFCTRALTSRQHKLLLIFSGPCDPDWQEAILSVEKKYLIAYCDVLATNGVS